MADSPSPAKLIHDVANYLHGIEVMFDIQSIVWQGRVKLGRLSMTLVDVTYTNYTVTDTQYLLIQSGRVIVETVPRTGGLLPPERTPKLAQA